MNVDVNDVCYLHDAIVTGIEFGYQSDGSRQLRLRMKLDAECGKDALNDAVIDVLLIDISFIIADMFCCITNPESFDLWHSGASDLMRQKVEKFAMAGGRVPKHYVVLVFHSGSDIEVAYEDVRFNIVTSTQ